MSTQDLLDSEHKRIDRKKARQAWQRKYRAALHSFLDACDLSGQAATDEQEAAWEKAYRKEHPKP